MPKFKCAKERCPLSDEAKNLINEAFSIIDEVDKGIIPDSKETATKFDNLMNKAANLSKKACVQCYAMYLASKKIVQIPICKIKIEIIPASIHTYESNLINAEIQDVWEDYEKN